MKTLTFAAAALLASVAVPASAAVTVGFAPGSGVTAGYTVFDDLESYGDGGSIGTNAFAYANSASGIAARPAFGSSGLFGAVLGTPTFGSATSNFAPTLRFGFVIGSVDTYNSLTLRFEDGSSQRYDGGQIINDLVFPSGNQIMGETNGFVTFVSNDLRIVGATFESTQNSFEFDNLAAGAVPEPATWALMIGGFGLVGGAMRRRGAAKVSFA